MIESVQIVSAPVSDQGKVRGFYVDTLGCELLGSGEKLRSKGCWGRPAAGAPDAVLPPRAWPGTNPRGLRGPRGDPCSATRGAPLRPARTPARSSGLRSAAAGAQAPSGAP